MNAAAVAPDIPRVRGGRCARSLPRHHVARELHTLFRRLHSARPRHPPLRELLVH